MVWLFVARVITGSSLPGSVNYQVVGATPQTTNGRTSTGTPRGPSPGSRHAGRQRMDTASLRVTASGPGFPTLIGRRRTRPTGRPRPAPGAGRRAPGRGDRPGPRPCGVGGRGRTGRRLPGRPGRRSRLASHPVPRRGTSLAERRSCPYGPATALSHSYENPQEGLRGPLLELSFDLGESFLPPSYEATCRGEADDFIDRLARRPYSDSGAPPSPADKHPTARRRSSRGWSPPGVPPGGSRRIGGRFRPAEAGRYLPGHVVSSGQLPRVPCGRSAPYAPGPELLNRLQPVRPVQP